jgi:hypothetical protein
VTKDFIAAAALGIVAGVPAQAADKLCIAASLAYSEGMVLCYGEHIQFVCGDDGTWKVTQAAPDPTKPPNSIIVNACIGMPMALPMPDMIPSPPGPAAPR